MLLYSIINTCAFGNVTNGGSCWIERFQLHILIIKCCIFLLFMLTGFWPVCIQGLFVSGIIRLRCKFWFWLFSWWLCLPVTYSSMYCELFSSIMNSLLFCYKFCCVICVPWGTDRQDLWSDYVKYILHFALNWCSRAGYLDHKKINLKDYGLVF